VDLLSSFISSIFHTVTAALGSILAVILSLLNTIRVIRMAFAAIGASIAGLAKTFEGLLKFPLSKDNYRYPWRNSANLGLTLDLGNVVVTDGVIVAFFLYSLYEQQYGRRGTAAPAKQKKIN